MIPKKNRLDKALFLEVFKKSKIFHGTYISLRINYGDYQISRFSVVVPKSVIPLAVNRNFLKRSIYNSIKVKPLNNYIGIITIKKEAKNVSFKDIINDTQETLQKYAPK